MVLRHEVLHARRQKLHLVDLPEAEMLAHGARQNQTRSENATDYSDRLLVAEMNRLGILIDITHGTEAVHKQLIETSRAPVVASHDTLRAVAGVGLSDEVLKALAAKGGLVGIHGGAAVIGRRYRQWMAADPENAANAARAV